MDRRKFIQHTVLASTGILVTSVALNGADAQSVPLGVDSTQTNLSVKGFGATGNGLTDDTDAIQSAINFAQQAGKEVFIPAGTYLITSLVLSKGIRLYGEGFASVLMVKSSVSPATDIITISPSVTSDSACYGYRLENFKIQAQNGKPGRHGIAIDIANRHVAYSEFKSLFISALGGNSFATLPNATPRIDGFFTSSIEKCILQGGIYLDKAGDSIRIQENTITGGNIGVYADLVTGAHSLNISRNNITSNGGTLYVRSASAGVFEGNNCEMPTPSGPGTAMIDIAGYSGSPVIGFVVCNNFIGSAIARHSTIRVDYAKGTVITGNYLARPAAAKTYIITANASSTRLINNIDALDETFASLASDSGINTLFSREFGGNTESTENLSFIAANKTIKWADSTGSVKRGIGLSAIDNTFNIGLQDEAASNGHLLFWANGLNYGRINPAGNWAIGTNYVGNTSAQLAVSSTTKGFLPPVMTSAQKNAIAAPANGLIVFDSTSLKLCVSVGGVWQTVASN